ncbi:MAG: restriction endonuclease subunit S [Proteobacteria bacterium]|nr:restriction endonuclease subunit S [Pseudomonadota bacterium]
MITASVQFSHLYRHLRIDAEFYKPEYLVLENALEKKRNLYPLRKYCNYIKKGIFDISPELYTSEGIPLIRTSEIKNPLINFSTTVFLDEGTHGIHYKTELKPNDIVMTKIGAYIGDIAILPKKYDRYNFSQNVTGLSVRGSTINSKYLFVFLLARFGHSQIKRIIMLSGQGKIELEDIRDISVYEASDDFQSKISELVEVGQINISKSESLFKEAENIVLSELGLTNWQPKHQLIFIKNYSDTKEAGRIDAEYYQPKYDEIIDAIKNYSGGWDKLDNLVRIKKNIEVGSGEYLDEGVPFIRVSNISPFEISEEKYISESLYNKLTPQEDNISFEKSKNHQPKQGEILFSKDGTPGIAYYLKEQPQKMIPSGGILQLKSKTDKVNSEYLTLVLNSILTQEQVNRDVGGSIIFHWRPDQVRETVIPILSEAKQAKIQKKVTESFNLRKQSKHLLECAKRAVEIAIEEDEQTAIPWLKNETKEMQRN